MNERESRLILADRRLPLTIEGRIEQCKLPGRRRLACQDTVAAAVKVKILRLIPYIVDGRQAGAGLEVHMR